MMDDRDFWIEARRYLVGLVGLIERRYGIEPVCRACAGCENCERLHRRQNDVRYTLGDRARPTRTPVN